MTVLDRTLFALAALGGAAGMVATTLKVQSGTLTESLKANWSQAFRDSPWTLAPNGALILTGLAVVASSAHLLLGGVGKKKKSERYLHGKKPSEIAREVGGQVGRCMPKKAGGEVDAVGAWDALIAGAIKLQASDLHLSPTPDGVNITYRVQGNLLEVLRIAPETLPPMAMRLKVMTKLDAYLRTAPQDGRLVVDLDGANIQARVSTLPTESGERMVLRFVRGNRGVPLINELGFSATVEKALSELLSRPQGLILVTGPVGSGKTTTLYSALQHISKTRGSTTIQVSLEDPIEIELPFATQTQINPKAGMTFANTLRSVLRQDPNVLMVGEIRDRETAEIAMQAGLTGHLILTTVHGQSAAGVFARLIEMDVEPFLLASATNGVLSQRLVRMLCTACRREVDADAATVARFTEAGVQVPAVRFFDSVGCEVCDGQGFIGQTPIGELLVVDEALQTAVKNRATTSEVEKLALEQGMKSLLSTGLASAERGETTLLEVLRVAG